MQEAEDNYYITAKYLLDLTQRAYELFESSELEERRQLIKLTLQNLRVDGKIVRYDAQKPFDTVLNYADNQLWLPEPHYLIPIDYTPAVQPMFNVGYFGEMKQRWEEIQRLQHNHHQKTPAIIA